MPRQRKMGPNVVCPTIMALEGLLFQLQSFPAPRLLRTASGSTESPWHGQEQRRGRRERLVPWPRSARFDIEHRAASSSPFLNDTFDGLMVGFGWSADDGSCETLTDTSEKMLSA